MRERTVLPLLALAGYGLYHHCRSILARLLKPPPPRHDVTVQRAMPLPRPGGVRLLADHYAPRADARLPTILIRTPRGRGKEVALAVAQQTIYHDAAHPSALVLPIVV